MKTIQQIQHQYDVLTLKEGKERGHLVALSNMGLLDENKIDLINNAIKIEGNALSESEKKSLIDLIHSLSSYALNEAPNEKFITTDKSVPVILLLKRKAIRVFPGDTKVGLYYSQTLDRYISIPFNSKGSPDQPFITEQRSKQNKSKNKQSFQDDRIISSLPPDLRALHKRNSDNEDNEKRNQAAREIINKTPDDDLHRIKGFGAIRAATRRYDDQAGGVSTAVRVGAKIGIGARILAQKYMQRKEKKQGDAAEVKKHTDNYSRMVKYAMDNDKDKKMSVTDKSKSPESVRAHYMKLAVHSKNRIKQLGGIIPKVKPQKRIVGPIASPKAGVIKPPALAEGIKSWTTNKLRNMRKKLTSKDKDKNKEQEARPDTNNPNKKNREIETNSNRSNRLQDSPNSNTLSPSSGGATENSFRHRVSVDQHQVRQNRAAWGADLYGKQRGQQIESNLNLIKKIAESNIQRTEIEFTDKSIPINYGIAKKFMAVYESLNTKNKEKVETMLNESSKTCSKAINFAIRS